MAKTIKNYGRSVKERLLNISRAEKYSSQLLISRYFQERLLYRLSVSDYKDKFILKGGALLYAHDGFQARPTLDIDFMAKNVSNDMSNIKKIFQEICQIECKEDGVVFDVDTIETSEIAISKEYHGVRLSLLAHLDTAQQNISMDIGFGDVITPSPQQLAFPALIGTAPGANILAYSLETVVAEKFQLLPIVVLNIKRTTHYSVRTSSLIVSAHYIGKDSSNESSTARHYLLLMLALLFALIYSRIGINCVPRIQVIIKCSTVKIERICQYRML